MPGWKHLCPARINTEVTVSVSRVKHSDWALYKKAKTVSRTLLFDYKVQKSLVRVVNDYAVLKC